MSKTELKLDKQKKKPTNKVEEILKPMATLQK